MPEEICRLLEWDSRFFERRIAMVTASRLTPGDGDAVRDWCRAHAVDCVYLRADPDDGETSRVAAAHGFELTDVRLEFERGLAGDLPAAAAEIRPAHAGDLEALRAIAGTAHRTTRFYFDTRFPRERCDDLYRTWITRSVVEGFADRVLVAAGGDEAVGYITVIDEAGGVGRIGLVGVAEAWRGRGVGRALIEAALASCAGGGARRVVVATQARNLAAVRAYERAGFRLAGTSIWYHQWPLDDHADHHGVQHPVQ